MKHQLYLLKQKRFLPLFITFFLGAANDNLFRNAMVILILYRFANEMGDNGREVVTLAAGVFILPFFLFSAIAGQLADKHEKSKLINHIKLAEIIIMSLGVAGLILGDSNFLLFVLFIMGAQSAFFGPVKYSILPLHLGKEELIGGNALMASGTFIAILIGTMAGSLFILWQLGTGIISVSLLSIAVAGWYASRFIPAAPSANPTLKIDYNLATATWKIINLIRSFRTVYLNIIAISWFWAIGGTLLAQFPNLAKFTFHGNNELVTLFLLASTIGIAAGALLCNRMLKGEISLKFVALGACGISVFLIDLWLFAPESVSGVEIYNDIPTFLSNGSGWHVIFDIFSVSICCGIYIVPLYAILQVRTKDHERSQIVAGNNIFNALFMVLSSLAATFMLAKGAEIPDLFLVIAIINLFFIFLTWRLRGNGDDHGFKRN